MIALEENVVATVILQGNLPVGKALGPRKDVLCCAFHGAGLSAYCPTLAGQGHPLGNSIFIPVPAGWVFSVWAFCCHMWALHELRNIPNFTKIILKMI